MPILTYKTHRSFKPVRTSSFNKAIHPGRCSTIMGLLFYVYPETAELMAISEMLQP